MEYITMSKREREQLIVFERLKKAEISQIEAALRLGLSTRWVRKKYRRYKEFGDIGLIHGNRGRTSKKRWNEQERALALDLLMNHPKWHEFGPTFAVEKLWEREGIKVSKEALRKAMIGAGINYKRRKKRGKTHRKRRERKERVGIMIQLDGSPHDWFEGRAPWCTLLVFIDDATSRIQWLEFVKSESRIDVLRATKNYVLQHGIPHYRAKEQHHSKYPFERIG